MCILLKKKICYNYKNKTKKTAKNNKNKNLHHYPAGREESDFGRTINPAFTLKKKKDQKKNDFMDTV